MKKETGTNLSNSSPRGGESTSLAPTWWPAILNGMESTVAVAFDRRGIVTAANRGYWLALGYAAAPQEPFDTSRYLFRPTLKALINTHAPKEARLYEGLIHIGDPDGPAMHTLRGWVTGHHDHWVLIAEHDIQSLQNLADQVLHLNQELAEMHRALKRKQEELRNLSIIDPLTDLANRRRLDERLELEIARIPRTQRPLTLALVDIDHFKRINDEHGHPVGDAVLKGIAEILTENLRSTDLAARYGGEEFCLLFPETVLAEALCILERIRHLIATRPIPPLTFPISASLGVVCTAQENSPETLIAAADRALYQAKQSGRDQVRVAELEPSTGN